MDRGRELSDDGRPRTTPDAVIGDRAHSSRAIRAKLRRRGIVAVTPEPRDQQAHRRRRGSRSGRPGEYDPVTYKGRNAVERFLNRIKRWRALATRYDKHTVIFRGAVIVAAILIWVPEP